MDFGLGALTGRPLALTGARVPSASAFLCSRVRRSFLEIGIVQDVCNVACDVDVLQVSACDTLGGGVFRCDEY